jgi:hypothetical protein
VVGWKGVQLPDGDKRIDSTGDEQLIEMPRTANKALNQPMLAIAFGSLIEFCQLEIQHASDGLNNVSCERKHSVRKVYNF